MNAPAKIDVKQTVAAPARQTFPVFGTLQREIDRLFEDFAPAFVGARGAAEIKCRMDLAETKDGFELTAEMPGVEDKNVEVTVRDGMLTVSGEKTFAAEEKDRLYHFVERGYGGFSRTIALPDGVMADKITATLAKGVLKVAIPAAQKTEPTRIAVQTAA